MDSNWKENGSKVNSGVIQFIPMNQKGPKKDEVQYQFIYHPFLHLPRNQDQFIHPRIKQCLNDELCTKVVTDSIVAPQELSKCWDCHALFCSSCSDFGCQCFCKRKHFSFQRNWTKSGVCDCTGTECKVLQKTRKRKWNFWGHDGTQSIAAPLYQSYPSFD